MDFLYFGKRNVQTGTVLVFVQFHPDCPTAVASFIYSQTKIHLYWFSPTRLTSQHCMLWDSRAEIRRTASGIPIWWKCRKELILCVVRIDLAISHHHLITPKDSKLHSRCRQSKWVLHEWQNMSNKNKSAQNEKRNRALSFKRTKTTSCG